MRKLILFSIIALCFYQCSKDPIELYPEGPSTRAVEDIGEYLDGYSNIDASLGWNYADNSNNVITDNKHGTQSKQDQ